MLISYNWLRELTGTILTPLELRECLTMVGLAIDDFEEAADDYILEVEVPSNRPDCLSHIGIAREVAVIESGDLALPPSDPPKAEGRAESFASVEITDTDLCPRYAGRVVRGVKIAPSPEWLVKRLEAIGQRPINNIADITNYVLHETGQPLHAFDLAKLISKRIIVRRAANGEKITTLDGVERKLDSEMLVIADAERAVAIAGVMGGENSEISNQTTDVLVESAYFDPDSVRRTARALGMDTEASRRFERGADYGGVIRAQDRCVELICKIAGGLATENAIDVAVELPPERRIDFHYSRVERLTSLRVAVPEMRRILKGLGFKAVEAAGASGEISSGETSVALIVPTWRVDVEREEDLVEEIARHTGYDKISSELPAANSSGEYQPKELQCRALRRALIAAGYNEAINFSFIDASHDDQIDPVPGCEPPRHQDALVVLQNPIVEDVVSMRPTLIPGLLDSLRHNLNHGRKDVLLFEIGRIFSSGETGELPRERDALALIASGGVTEQERAQAMRQVDFQDLKGALEAAVDATRMTSLTFEVARVKHLREGQTAAVNLNGSAIGSAGRLSEEIAAAYKFRQPVYVAEIDLAALFSAKMMSVQYHPLDRFPAVVRDVTLLVGRDVTFAGMIQTVLDQKVAHCRNVRLVGVYEGPNIPEDKRSITLRIEYRADERTLRDDEVEEVHRRIVDVLALEFDAQLH